MSPKSQIYISFSSSWIYEAFYQNNQVTPSNDLFKSVPSRDIYILYTNNRILSEAT